MKKVALLGLGRMGSGIALSILRRGQELRIWNRSKDKATEVLAAGGVWCENPAAAAHDADIVLAMLADDIASEQVWLGPNGALPVMRLGACMVECSTLSLDFVHRLAGIAQQSGLHYIDCPVTGIPAAAVKGELTLLVGADAKDLESCKPVLSMFSSTIRYFGTVGKGTGYKLVINLMGAIQIAGLAEGIALCDRLELDRETFIQAIENSAAASPQVVRYVRRMAERNYAPNPSFTVNLREKDAAYAITLANNLGFDSRLGKAAGDWFKAAKKQYGDEDEARVIEGMMEQKK